MIARKGLKVAHVVLLLHVATSQGETAKIVGTGVATCSKFLDEIARNPLSEREYFSWAQGYMSGILMRAPPGKDDGLNLLPIEFPVTTQLSFFRTFCATHPQTDFVDATLELYKRLREFSRK